jgi:hypothetical protein
MPAKIEKVWNCQAKQFRVLVTEAADEFEAKLACLSYLEALHAPYEYLDYADVRQVRAVRVHHVVDAVKQLHLALMPEEKQDERKSDNA